MAGLNSNNSKLFREAKKYLVGGVDSPVRSFGYIGSDPVLIKSGLGPRVYDYDGNAYIDYVLSWGAAILGHADSEVVAAVSQAIKKGAGFGATNAAEIELARTIEGAIPFIKKLRFVNSGTEAVMGAIRLARGYTGRDKILKLENSYHGHADYLLAKSGSGLATLGIPSSAGVPNDFVRHTLSASYGDIEAAKRIFKKRPRDIAAVIVEPVGANYGVTVPDIGYLKALRALTKRYGAILIFDEVVTGFRLSYGSAAQALGVTPDLVTLGKIIGGGLPVGAYGGREDIMERLAPSGDVYQASTFSGNPVVMSAGIATLKKLKASKNGYRRMHHLAKRLSYNISDEAMSLGLGIEITNYAGMFSMKFRTPGAFRIFYREMLKRGVYFAPSEFEANFISFAHTEKEIEKTARVAGKALKAIS